MNMETITRSILLFILIIQSLGMEDEQQTRVSCGSAIRLRHMESNFFLKSAAQTYPSGQQGARVNSLAHETPTNPDPCVANSPKLSRWTSTATFCGR